MSSGSRVSAGGPRAGTIAPARGVRLLLLALVRGYRVFLSPLVPRACRFEPSCSTYAEQALERRSVPAALGLIARRLLRCHPFHPGGYDPVP